MRLLFEGSIPKDLAFPFDNEDAHTVYVPKGRIAVSDGASESYDARTWSGLLAKRFVHNLRLGPGWMARATAEYAAMVHRDALSWSKQASFDRGSFATLLGVQEHADREALQISCVGDTLAALLNGSDLAATFPYTSAAEFRQRPQLLGTNNALNGFLSDATTRAASRRTWCLRGMRDPVLLCMTDGLAEWAVRESLRRDDVWSELAAVRLLPDLETLVFRERNARNMRIDDVTLVTVALSAMSL